MEKIEQLTHLKFKGGDVTSIVDLEKTLGTLYYMGHEVRYFYDEEKAELTNEIVSYDVTVISEKTGSPYKVKLDRNDMDFSTLKLRDKVELVVTSVKFYQDSGSLTRGSTISITAIDLRKVAEQANVEPNKNHQTKDKSK